MGAALPFMMGIAGAGAGAAQGTNQAQANSQQYALTKRGQALQEGLNANSLERQTQTNPLRDQAIYNLSGMLGAAPAAFNPTSFLNPGNAGLQGIGGVNQNALGKYQGDYTPGAGGVNSNVQQMMLNRLGYGNVNTGTLYDNPSTPADTLTGKPSAAITTGSNKQGGAGAKEIDDPMLSGAGAGTTSGNPSVGTGTGPGNPGSVTQNPQPSTGMLNATTPQVYAPPTPSAQALGVATPAVKMPSVATGMNMAAGGLMGAPSSVSGTPPNGAMAPTNSLPGSAGSGNISPALSPSSPAGGGFLSGMAPEQQQALMRMLAGGSSAAGLMSGQWDPSAR